MVILFLGLYYLLKSLARIPGRALFSVALYSVGVVVAYYSLRFLFQDARINNVVNYMIENPLLILYDDQSVNARITHFLFAFKGFFDSYFLPSGFDSFHGYMEIQSRLYPDLIWRDVTYPGVRIQSGLGSFFFEVGIFTLLFIYVAAVSIGGYYKGRYLVAVPPLIGYVLVAISAIPLGFPMFALILAYMQATTSSSPMQINGNSQYRFVHSAAGQLVCTTEQPRPDS